MDALAREDNIGDLKAALNKLPQDLNATYKDALQRVRNQQAQRVRRAEQVLMWITFAQRPLKLSELLCALTIRLRDQRLNYERLPMEELLLSACCGLVIVDRGSQIIRFVHYTTEEYIATIRHDLYPRGHQDITATLLMYLSVDTFDGLDGHDDIGFYVDQLFADFATEHLNEPNVNLHFAVYLLLYAVKHWMIHAQQVFETENAKIAKGCPSSMQQIRDMIMKFPDKKNGVLTFLAVRLPVDCGFPERWRTSKLHIASAFQLIPVVNSLLNGGVDINQGDYGGDTALHSAVIDFRLHRPEVATGEGRLAIAKLLLAKGASIDRCNFFHQTPLNLAVYKGDIEMVKCLIEKGADINGRSDHEIPLLKAVMEGNEVIVQLLLRRGANIHKKDSLGDGVLHKIKWNHNCRTLAKLLLDNGADLEW